MSYIRSTSNPEELYIYGCEDGIIHVSCKELGGSEHSSMTLPKDDFEQLIKDYHSEKYVDLEDIGSYASGSSKLKELNDGSIRLSHDGQRVRMHLVTWEYIVYNFMCQHPEEFLNEVVERTLLRDEGE